LGKQWQAALENFVSHSQPKAGVFGIQLAVFSKKTAERQRLAKRTMRSFQNLFINRITDEHAVAVGATTPCAT
jgi:hypothetical protein